MRVAALCFAFALMGAVKPALTPADLAGSYYSGDGLGVNWSLRLQPNGDYDFAWNGCLGLYDKKVGRARFTGNELILGGIPKVGESVFRLPDRLRPVRWGRRLYLVPDDYGAEFLASINAESEPRKGAHGLALLRQDDWQQTADGEPELPEEWRKWRHVAPIHASIANVSNKGRRATINVGSDRGVHPGLLLTARDSYIRVRVVSVEEHSSVVETTFDGDRISAGLRVTTGR